MNGDASPVPRQDDEDTAAPTTEDVDALIAKYRDVGVGASELLIAVQKKYARDQPQRRANQFSV